MKRHYILLLLCAIVCIAQAQKLTRSYQAQSLSRVLEDLNAATDRHEISFVYNDLEDFTVTCHFERLNLEDALMKVVGFYPVRIVRDGERYYVECTHKTERHLKGRLTDEHQQPLAYANISLLSPADSSLIGGGVSNEAGDFVIPTDAYRVIVKCSFIGYETIWHTCEVGDIGSFQMKQDSYTLKGVTVKGAKRLVYSTDKGLVANVQGTVLEQFGSVSDMLTHLPLMMSDGSVAGRGKPEIYINNKKVRDESELDRLRADEILSAEIITNPGAEYGAEIRSVIRLKTVRKAGEGWSGNFAGTYRQGEQWYGRLNAALNYRTRNGMDFFAKGNITESNSLMTYPGKSELIGSSTWNYEKNMNWHNRFISYYTDFGWNWEINEHHSVGVTYTLNSLIKGSRSNNEQDEKVWQEGLLTDNVHTSGVTNEKPKLSHSINAYYVGEIGKWKFDFSGDFYRNQNLDEMSGYDNGQLSASSTTHNKNRLLAEKLTVTAPVPKGSLTFGEEVSNVDRTSDFTQNGFSADNQIHQKTTTWSLYANYGLNIKEFTLNASLRWQNEHNSYEQNGQYIDEVSRNYHVLIPRISASYVSGNWNHTLSYNSHRLNPSYSLLSSSVDYAGKYEYRTGNPFLQPQTHDIISWESRWKWLYAMLKYDYTRNVYTDFHTIYDEIEHPGVELMDFRMIPSIQTIALVLNVSPKIGIWQINYTAAFDFSDWELEPMGITQNFKGVQIEFNLDNTLTLPHSWLFNIQANISPAADQGFNQNSATGSLDFRLSKQFLKDKSLSVALVANDILHTSNFKTIQYNGIGYRCEVDVYRDQRRVGLDLSWKFNAAKSRYKGSHAGQSERDRL